MVKFTSSLIPVMAAFLAAAPASAHVKSTLESLYCKSAMSKFNYGCGSVPTYGCLCAKETYIATYVKCLITLSPNDQSHAVAGFGHMIEHCNGAMSGMGTSAMVSEATFVDDYNDAIENNLFVDASSISNKSELLTNPLTFTIAEVKWVPKDGAKFRYQLYTGTLYGGIIMAYWALVVVLGIAVNIVCTFAPQALVKMNSPALIKFRQKIALPATFRARHSSPTFLGYIPTRAQSIVLTLYLILNIILCFVHYDLISFEVKKLQLARYVADRTGIISFAHFPIVFLFSGRNNMMLWVTGWSYDTFSAYHRWVSRCMVLHAVIHSIAWSVYCTIDGSFSGMFSDTYWNWGVAATVIGCVMVGFSAHFFRSRFYELFQVLHIVFAIVFTIGCVWHSYYMGWMQWIWAGVSIWAFDRFLRVARIGINGYSVAQGKLYGAEDDDAQVFKLSVSTANAHKYAAGSHIFIHVLKPLSFWQSHPFTVYRSPVPGQQNELMICGKVRGGITKKIAQDLAKYPNKYNDNILLALDGPYGNHHQIAYHDTVILVAGGIGVTSTFAYASNLLASAASRSQRIVFIWITPNEFALEWFGPELQSLAKSNQCDIELFLTSSNEGSSSASDFGLSSATHSQHDKSVEATDADSFSKEQQQENKNGNSEKLPGIFGERVQLLRCRPDANALVTSHIQASTGSTAVLVCGPPSLNDDVRRSTVQNLGSTKGRVDYFEEAFSF